MSNMEFCKGPILITGTFRSGTTLIAQMIRNHPAVDLVYDSVNFMRFSYRHFDPIHNCDNVKNLLAEVVARISDRFQLSLDIDGAMGRLSERFADQTISYAYVYDALMQELLLSRSGKAIWGEKTTLVWTQIPAFLKMFPRGRVIHIIRDPRAVLASWRKMTHAPGNDYLDAIFNCIGSMEKMTEYVSLFAHKRYAAVKYENIVHSPGETLQHICRTLELDFNEQMMDSSSYLDKSGRQWQGNSMFMDTMPGISIKTVERWKDVLNDWEIWLVENLAGFQMETHRYAKENPGPTNSLTRRAIAEIESSRLVVNGAVTSLLTNHGFERFPNDPMVSTNWDKDAGKY